MSAVVFQYEYSNKFKGKSLKLVMKEIKEEYGFGPT